MSLRGKWKYFTVKAQQRLRLVFTFTAGLYGVYKSKLQADHPVTVTSKQLP